MDSPSRIGRYAVERLLGEGGMGRVFLARDTVLGRRVAVKILRDDLGLPPELRAELVERMRQEARIAAALAHPGIVTLHDMGEDEAVGLYLVFELVEGPTLRQRLEQGEGHTRPTPLPPLEVAAMARALGSALSYAHAAGVVHRDVKPENVMLPRTGAKLTDLGIARLPDSTLTGTSVVLGTPAYSAPEALASGAHGPRSDQFSLAVTLYEALTGVRAFPGEDALAVTLRVASGLHERATAVVSALRGFAELDAIFARALSPEASARFPSCVVFGDLLAAQLEGVGATAGVPVPPSSRVTRATRKLQNVAAVLGVAVLVGLVVVGRFQPEERGVSLHELAETYASAVGITPRPAIVPHRARTSSSPPASPSGTASAAPSAEPEAGADAPPGKPEVAEPAGDP